MAVWNRRQLVKRGIAASAGLWSAPVLLARPDGRGAARPTHAQPAARVAAAGREKLLLDRNWRFHFGNADDPDRDFGFGSGEEFAKTGGMCAPSHANFDASSWRQLDLPHDWVVELDFMHDDALFQQGYKPVGRSYPETSIGWYRREFDLPESDRGRRIALEFDGVFRDALVVMNGIFLGRNMSGYAPFRLDISDVATYGGRNVLVVRADATEHEGWFYEGAGIYRHAWLVKTNPVHVAPGGTYVRSAVRGAAATLTAQTEIENESDQPRTVTVTSEVRDPGGTVVATGRSAASVMAPWSRRELSQLLTVRHPALWSLETPALYTLVTTVHLGADAVDQVATTFGIRTYRWDANQGLLLNGKRVAIKGTCNHQDHAGVGSALPDRLQYYRIERLKTMGSNAIRTSHNPPTAELLDACDTLGMLVLDETRMMSSSEEGLSQFERLIRRDRNRPSVFAWSIGNEEGWVQGDERGAAIASSMKRLARRLDPSRPITEAMNGGWGHGLTTVVDVMGFNYYRAPGLDEFHRQFPALPAFFTEVASALSTRGIYANDPVKGYMSAYDTNAPPWGSTCEYWWKDVAGKPWVGGGFVWTGFDYRGEPTPYKWPCISSHFGVIDTCGFPKDNFYYYQAWWGDAPMLHLFPHWNWAGREGQNIEVWCHSNLDSVELFLNGRSFGSQNVARQSHVSWQVPYEAGTLEARGSRGGAVVLTDKRETTGPAAQIQLVADRPAIDADGADVVVVEAHVLDAQNRLVPLANDQITFTVTGPGAIIGVGNGDPSDHDPDKATARHAFGGLCVVIVQATRDAGTLRVDATAPGLTAGSASVECRAAPPRPEVD